MSKTVRKKNGWDAPSLKFEFIDDGNIFCCVQKKYDKNSEDYKLEKNKYHRDGSVYGGSVPHEWVNLNREKPMRQRTKAILKKWVKNPNFEPSVPLYRRDAGYYYW